MNAKLTGIIGAGLIALSFIPSVSIFFMILGLIFLGVSLNCFSNENEKIFNYFLAAALLLFIGNILFYFKIVAIVISLILGVFSSNPIIPVSASIVFYFLIYYVVVIISAVYFKKSFDMLGEALQNRYFHISGYFLVTGAVLNILFIGFILWIIGWIFVIIGFAVNDDIIDAEIVEIKEIEKN